MLKQYRLPLLILTASLIMSGCYTQTLVTPKSETNLEIGAKYKATWDSAPKRSRDYLKGTLFHLKQKKDGSYTLQYKQGPKKENKTLNPLKIGNSHYVQIFGAGAYELMRVETRESEIDLYAEIPGCNLKNGDDQYPDINMIKLGLKSCTKALGITEAEMKVEGDIGRIIFQDKPEVAIQFLEKYGDKMYAKKRYTLMPM